MPLYPGDQLGPYEILGPLGEGGMGEVYRARDRNLRREVAIMVLPESLASDPGRLARFRREAEVLASLNHPNIASIYGIEGGGTEGGALVLELVDGPMLSERIRQGAIPIDETLDLIRQMVDALEYAHERGVIHRDLKPANIKITDAGVLKILDFGLAKALDERAEAREHPADSPTLTAVTQAGIVIGTAAYMSPEQATGKAVDRRADIFSFGVVVFEMLAGTAAFAGDSIVELLAAVVKSDPDWAALPNTTPIALRKVVERCLRKDRKQRLQAIGDVRILLEEVEAVSSTTEGAPNANSRRAWLPWALAGVLFIAAAAGLWNRTKTQPIQNAQTVRYAIPWPNGGTSAHALSRDGSMIAYVGGPRRQIHLRRLDSMEAAPLEGTEGAIAASFSPDGEWIAFFFGGPSAGNPMKVSVRGGVPQKISEDAGAYRQPSWGPDGSLLFTTTAGVVRTPPSGGPGRQLFPQKRSEALAFPQLLPGNNAILVSVLSADGVRVEAHELSTGKVTVLIAEGGVAQLVRSGPGATQGHLLYVRAGALWAAPMNFDRVALTGTPTAVVNQVHGTGSTITFAVSESGTLAYQPATGGEGEGQTLVWVDRSGNEEPIPAPRRQFASPRLTPAGDRVAVTVKALGKGRQLGLSDIWSYDIARTTFTRLTFEGESKASARPVWTPDGKSILYSSIPPEASDADNRLMMLSLETGGTPLPVAQGAYSIESVSPDGKVAAGRLGGQSSSLFVIPLPGSGETTKPKLILPSPFRRREPQISPDGKWVAYQSDESGRDEIYAERFPGGGGKVQVSTEGGAMPRWAVKSGELFYRNGNQMMAVSAELGAAFNASQPKALFEGKYEGGYDVTAAGRRFLMIKSASDQVPEEIHVVVNWFPELRKLAPPR